MVKTSTRIATIFAALLMMTQFGWAHTGVGGTSGFAHGFSHPLGGLDHMLAMVAVGLLAVQLGSRALWLVPLSFLAMMAVGGAAGVFGIKLPLIELGIAGSVIVLGALVALQASITVTVAMGLVGFFAIFHGFAHGAEMPVNVSGFTYAAGFMTATAILHGLGMAFGLAIGSLAQGRFVRASRVAGGVISLAGAGILTGVI
mgnify:CR=1 FL=1|jgi:urease accessory protein